MYEGIVGTSGLIMWSRNDETRSVWATAATDDRSNPIGFLCRFLRNDAHPGITRMKMIARSIVWWPGIDNDIDKTVKNCPQCQQNQKAPSRAPLHQWEWPNRPWTRLHIDHAGPFLGKYFLVVADAHSKWIEIMVVPSTSSQSTIRSLRSIFATHGLPEILVSDNASGFTSSEFQDFLTRNGIRHITAAPYHPATNGLAERTVQTFKRSLRKSTPGDIETELTRFLFHYRTTPHCTTGAAPAELLLGRLPRTHHMLMRPDLSARVRNAQYRQKLTHDTHAKEWQFSPHDPVYVRNFGRDGSEWLPGEISQAMGECSYTIKLADGRNVRRHIDHIRVRTCMDNTLDTTEDDYDDLPAPTANTSQPTQPLRRSSRIRNAPERFT